MPFGRAAVAATVVASRSHSELDPTTADRVVRHAGLRAATDDAGAPARDARAMTGPPTPTTTPRVLVAYASKRGATAEIAEAIAAEIAAAGLDVECASAETVKAIDAYDAVVLGSATYMRRWRPEARRFLHRHRDALARRSLWVFSSGPVGEAEPDPKWTEPARTIAEVERLGAREHVVFGGRVPAEPHGFIERAMVRDTPPEVADRRDWDEIRAWARAIAQALQPAAAAR